ncbi:MAG: hypothetical protein Q7U04_09180 [Bacteriovorax sp.]|nr:hypothetical protein [Bacteriovorax sp.]
MSNNKNGLKLLMTAVLYGACLIFNTSCSGFLPDRSFIEEMNRESDPFLQAGKDFPVVSGDAGEAYRSRDEIQKRTPTSERNRKQIKEQDSIKQELIQKEAEIPVEGLGQYTKDKKFLPTDSDKLYYLSLSNPERSNYINIKKQDMQDDQGKGQDFIQKRSVHNTELYLGMPKAQVVQVWGKPSRIEIAGNPKNQNERWSFVEDGSVKQIYFESGKVGGWALDL